MSTKTLKDHIEVKLNYKGVTYNESFKTKEEVDAWFKKIVEE